MTEEVFFPPNNEIPQIKEKFSRIAGLPSFVVGCIDGCLININAPHQHEYQYVDRHGNHSINLSAICGPDNIIYWFNCNYPGSVNDARVLRESDLFNSLLYERLLPPRSVLLGDSAYPALVINTPIYLLFSN